MAVEKEYRHTGLQAFMPAMVEGETLYSLVGHYHRLSGNAYTIKTSRQLFGDIFSGFRVDFPSQLDHFVEVSEGLFGDAATLIHERSLLGFFSPFLSEESASRTMGRMRGEGFKPLKAGLGIIANRIGTFHWLKACDDCIREDIQRFWISKWYLEHQWPSAWICSRHQKPLKVVRRELLPNRHTNLLLPNEIERDGWVEINSSAKLSESFLKVAEFMAGYAGRRGFHFDLEILRFAYLIGVKNRGWIRTDGSVNAELWGRFQQHYVGFEMMPEILHGKLNSQSRDFVFNLLRHSDYRQHPIRHYLLMAFLFDSPSELDAAYAQAHLAYSQNGMEGIRELLSENFRTELCHLIEQGGQTIESASASLGITFTQAKNIIEKYGIKYRKRYELDAVRESQLHELICKGTDRKEIAEQFGVDVPFLKYYFRKKPWILEIWRAQNLLRRKQEYRQLYRLALSKQGLDTVTKLLDFPKSGFWWLRTHDLDWLIENSPLMVRRILLESRGESMATITLDELLGSEPSFLPQLTEGETLFSWAARFHRLSGNALARTSSIQLFGESRAGLRHDFPSHLDRLVEITEGLLGDAETLAYDRTMFGFFAPFQSLEGAAAVFEMMRGNTIEKVKSALGLLPSRLGGYFPMKACQDCITDDMKRSRVSRWHVEHQWPSVWVCRKHGKQLLALRRESQPKDMRRWLLPEDVTKEEWAELPICSTDVKERLTWIAEISADFANQRGRHFDQRLLRYTYLFQAKEHGWLFTDGSLKLAEFRKLFLDYYRGVDGLPGFEVIQSVTANHGGMLGVLMRQYDSRRHPMKHLLLIAFLFDSVSQFDEVYERVQQADQHGGDEALSELVGESWRFELKRLVEVEGESVSNAAKVIGIHLSVAIRVANQEGIKYQRRSRVLNTELGEEIKVLIAEGLSREEIVEKAGIKKTLLKDLMAREPSLREEWRQKDFERRKNNYRVNFVELAEKFRGVPVKRLRSVSGNGVSWLYRNDRDWLLENLPCVH